MRDPGTKPHHRWEDAVPTCLKSLWQATVAVAGALGGGFIVGGGVDWQDFCCLGGWIVEHTHCPGQFADLPILPGLIVE
jgi:hypothetical protein